MARNKAVEERVKTLVAELLAEEKRMERSGGPAENINDIEDAMVRIGDMVAQEFGLQKLAEHTDSTVDPQCPECGHEGVHVGDRSRELLTRRGPVPLTEAKYRCPKCRRHFFPSDESARD